MYGIIVDFVIEISIFLYRHAQNYLKFLGGDKSFRFSATPNLLIPIPLTFRPHPILPDPNHLRYRQLSKRLYTSLDMGNLKSYSNPGLNETPPTSVKTLLKQEDKRGISRRGLSHRLKNLKYSQNSLSKKMTVLKSKLGDSIGEEMDEDVIVANKKKGLKKTNSESNVMAELLARSVIHAHNSLSCILEIHSPTHDENDNNDEDTLEKLKPIANLLDKTASEQAGSSDENASEKCLSSCDSSSSGSDYDYDDETLEYTNSNFDLETISNIVKDVELKQKSNKAPLQKQVSLPSFGPNRVKSLDSLSENILKFSEVADKNFSVFTTCSEDNMISHKDNLLSENYCTKNINVDNCPSKKDIVFQQGRKKKEISNKQDVENVDGISVIKDIEIKDESLTKTAMQTLLLEKVSIMGTYTTPMSPVFKSKMDFTEEKCDIQDYDKLPERNINLTNIQSKSNIKKSASLMSFHDYLKENDTVLGAPFTSIGSLNAGQFKKQKSQPCFSDNVKLSSSAFKSFGIETSKLERQNCFSDTQLHKPLVKMMLNESLEKKHNGHKLRFKLFQSKYKMRSHKSSLNEQKKCFWFLRRNRKSSEGDWKEQWNIISRIFPSRSEKALIVDEDNKEDTSELKNLNLIDISCTTTSSSSALTDTNYTPCNFSMNSPDNIKIDRGSNCNKNKHACITPNRHNTSTQADQNGTQCGQSPEHHKADQSPARIGGVSCIHRRSSDSDLSITPKGG